MGCFDRLKGNASGRERPVAKREMPTVKAPAGYPGLRPPAAPAKRKKTREQCEEEVIAYRQSMRSHFAAIAAFNRKRAVALGIKSYVWVAVDVHGDCEVAKRNGGKIFSYTEAPAEGHVCEGQCTSKDWCRCIARAVIDGFS
jgi:hypothetical protein